MEGEYVVLAERPNGSLRIAPAREEGELRLVALRQMTSTFPAQWEGTLEDGRTLFAHFKHGRLSVGVGADRDDAIDNSLAEKALLLEDVGEFLRMDTEALRGYLYGLVEFPEDLVVEQGRWALP